MIHGVGDSNHSINDFCKIHEQPTLISDLSLTEDELLKRIKKNTKYEIRRAEKEGIVVNFYGASEITPDLLGQFKENYESMYASKGMKRSFNMDLVKAYIEKDMIYFSIAYYNEEPLVFHSYIVDSYHVRFFYSCSPFRSEPDIANLIGRMNRYLHWQDFMQFKKMGIVEYDWGGINSIDEPNSIAQFKFAFGGHPVIRYNYIIGRGLIGKLLVKYKF